MSNLAQYHKSITLIKLIFALGHAEAKEAHKTIVSEIQQAEKLEKKAADDNLDEWLEAHKDYRYSWTGSFATIAPVVEPAVTTPSVSNAADLGATATQPTVVSRTLLSDDKAAPLSLEDQVAVGEAAKAKLVSQQMDNATELVKPWANVRGRVLAIAKNAAKFFNLGTAKEDDNGDVVLICVRTKSKKDALAFISNVMNQQVESIAYPVLLASQLSPERRQVLMQVLPTLYTETLMLQADYEKVKLSNDIRVDGFNPSETFNLLASEQEKAVTEAITRL
jgi:hypothetical protein